MHINVHTNRQTQGHYLIQCQLILQLIHPLVQSQDHFILSRLASSHCRRASPSTGEVSGKLAVLHVSGLVKANHLHTRLRWVDIIHCNTAPHNRASTILLNM